MFSRISRHRRRAEQLRAEVEAHLAHEIDDLVARGYSWEAAEREACRRFGNITQLQEKVHEMKPGWMIEILAQDLRQAVRMMRLNPSFAMVAAISLALGIGANVAIFQLVNAVLLRSLPVERPHELLSVDFNDGEARSGMFHGPAGLSYPVYQRLRDRQTLFSGVAAWGEDRFNLRPSGDARYVNGLWVSGNFFPVLGTRAAVGRLFTAADDRGGCGASSGAVLSWGFYQNEFGGDPEVLSRTVTLGGHTFSIIGVAQPEFFGPLVGRRFDVALPLCAERLFRGVRSGLDDPARWWLSAFARLKPGQSAKSADSELAALSPAIMRETVQPNARKEDRERYLRVKLVSRPAALGESNLRRTYEPALWLLMAAVMLVLLIACANIGNLLLARGSVRTREIAVRLALGASRGRLVRQLMAESLLLAAIGAGAGLWLAGYASRLLTAFLSTSRNHVYLDLSLDWRVAAFTVGAGLATCLAFGLAPAFLATRTEPAQALRSATRSLTQDRGRKRLRQFLVVSQVALSLLLLSGSFLLMKSLRHLRTHNAGFARNGILVASIDYGKPAMSSEQQAAAAANLIGRLRSLPGGAMVSAAAIVPLSGMFMNDLVVVDTGSGFREVLTFQNVVFPDYFKTMGTRLLAGRDFTPLDMAGKARTVIANQAFVDRHLGGGNAIGRTVGSLRMGGARLEIVGVVEDSRYSSLGEEATPQLFLPAAPGDDGPYPRRFVLRSTLPPAQLIPQVRRVLLAERPQSTLEFEIFEQRMEESIVRERLLAVLTLIFSGLATLVAVIGLYGVVAYMVERRRGEFGIRLSLGARPSAILRLVLRESLVLVSAGTAAGLVLTMALASPLRAVLRGVQPHDPAMILLAAAVLMMVALLASYLPAASAARTDPLSALRDE
jgi:predicted permease